MSIYNSNGKPVKHKSHKGVLIGFFIVLILIIAFVSWIWSESVNQERLFNAGCEGLAWNQWGFVTTWRCPAGVELYE